MSSSIFEVLLSVFFTALIVSAIFRQLKLSAILGYLVVGAIVGPHALGLIPNSDHLNKLAQFGIVFLMFTVGLEFSLPKLFALRSAVFTIGGLQVLICVLVVTGASLFFKMSLATSLVMGSIVAMSSTALVVKQLNDQFELQTPHGMNAVGILLFQDLAVIPLIILITSLDNPQQGFITTLLWSLTNGILAILLIFIIGKWLLKPLFKFITQTRAIELFTLTVLLVTLFSAWITQILGLSYSLGAFLAGMMLAETEYRHQIEVEIRPFRDMLLALFFISIGMLTNFEAWDNTSFWILLLVSALVFGKMLVIIILCRLTGNYTSTSIRTGIVLAQGGEFGFAILDIAATKNLIPPDYQQVVLAALLISIAIAPLMIRFNKQIAKLLWSPSYDISHTTSQIEVLEKAKELKNHIIICGYGRVGQQIARILDKSSLSYIGLDLDSELVQRASLAGDNVMYGDSSHPGILAAAGIAHARGMVISLGDHRAAIKIVTMVRSFYPNLPIIVRCRDNMELDQLKESGATNIITELFETSLAMSHQVLQLFKLSKEKITSIIQEMRTTNYDLLQQVFVGTYPFLESEDESLSSEQLTPIIIPAHAYAVNHKLADFNLKEINVQVASIRRGNKKHLKPLAKTIIRANDIIVLYGTMTDLEHAEKLLLEGLDITS